VFYFPIQNCVLLNGADCDGRPLLRKTWFQMLFVLFCLTELYFEKIEESIKTIHCPKKTGLFPHEDPAHCDKYYQVGLLYYIAITKTQLCFMYVECQISA
jgi:hypothetical protein